MSPRENEAKYSRPNDFYLKAEKVVFHPFLEVRGYIGIQNALNILPSWLLSLQLE